MEKQIIEHANIFLSIPMTLHELSMRTNTKEEVLIEEFSEKLYIIDEALAKSVGKVLEFLEIYYGMLY